MLLEKRPLLEKHILSNCIYISTCLYFSHIFSSFMLCIVWNSLSHFLIYTCCTLCSLIVLHVTHFEPSWCPYYYSYYSYCDGCHCNKWNLGLVNYFYSILFCSALFYPILIYSFLFYSIKTFICKSWYKKLCINMSQRHLINADLLPVKPQMLLLHTSVLTTLLLQRLRYAPMKTQVQRKKKRKKRGFAMFHFPPARMSWHAGHTPHVSRLWRR